MSDPKLQACLNHPKFKQLVASRGRLNRMFSLVIFIGFSIFVLGMAFAPALMSVTLSADSNISYGILFGIFMIILGVVTSGVYMRLANKGFDVLQQQLLKELNHE